MKPVIKWTGSKRLVAKELLKLFPEDYDTYYEPFVGGGALSYYQDGKNVYCSDSMPYLIDMWQIIQNDPERMIEEYATRWNEFKSIGKKYYFETRNRFNTGHDVFDFFFLNRTAVNGLVRFNKKGEFNAALGYGRNGATPETLTPIILDWSRKIQGYTYSVSDYRDIEIAGKSFVFLDPPYVTNNDMYTTGQFNYIDFQEWLNRLTNEGVKWMVTTRTKLDCNYKTVLETSGGNSSFRRLVQDRTKVAKEYIYMNY